MLDLYVCDPRSRSSVLGLYWVQCWFHSLIDSMFLLLLIMLNTFPQTRHHMPLFSLTLWNIMFSISIFVCSTYFKKSPAFVLKYFTHYLGGYAILWFKTACYRSNSKIHFHGLKHFAFRLIYVCKWFNLVTKYTYRKCSIISNRHLGLY